jgi:twitching motility protein PilT
MKAEIRWLVILGTEKNLFSIQSCLTVAQSLDDDTDIAPFAEELLKEKACSDFDGLQDLVVEAYELSQKGEPPYDPFQKIATPQSQKEETQTKYAFKPPETMPDWSEAESLDRDGAEDFMRRLLTSAQEIGSSDVHISAGARPFLRHNTAIQYLHEDALAENTAYQLNVALLNSSQKDVFDDRLDLDFALSLGQQQRYRVNLMMQRAGASGTYRVIPPEIPKLQELGFEDMAPISKLLTYPNGLILLTGPICSGKSATLAAMIDDINSTRKEHLIVIEEPIEIVQTSKSCQVTQREVGKHTRSFSKALKSALRQDPDIIVIGELRDLETIEIAITASETGHLVIGTLHTSDAANTLNRVLDIFPPSQQMQIRVMLSHALRGIICQRLIPSTDGHMALAYELLLNNTAVRNLIHDNKPEGLSNVMETGSAEGMRLMDKSILSLWENDRISDQVALQNLKSEIKRQQLRQLIKLQRPTHETS